MPNPVKKMNKAAVGLHPGEEIVAVLILHPKGTSLRVAGGPLAGGIAERLRKDEHGDLVTDEGMAARMPDGPLALNMTGSRVLACTLSKMSGKPAGVDAEFARGTSLRLRSGRTRSAHPS